MGSSQKHVASFRFYGSLNDFLPASRQQGELRYSFWGKPAVKDAIEAQGIPHPEVDMILVNGTAVSFAKRLTDGDYVSVYPWITSLPRPVEALRPDWPSPFRFVCDVHLGQLARYLRMIGIDTWYDTECSDPALARIAEEEDRVLLTRDLGLLKRGRVQRGAFIRAQVPRQQLAEVIRRFPLPEIITPLDRCLECNERLEEAPQEGIREQVPQKARDAYEHFVQCPSCQQVFWEGTHVERMHDLIESVTSSDQHFTSEE